MRAEKEDINDSGEAVFADNKCGKNVLGEEENLTSYFVWIQQRE